MVNICTNITKSDDLGRKMRRGYQIAICASDSSGGAFRGVFAFAYSFIHVQGVKPQCHIGPEVRPFPGLRVYVDYFPQILFLTRSIKEKKNVIILSFSLSTLKGATAAVQKSRKLPTFVKVQWLKYHTGYIKSILGIHKYLNTSSEYK